MNILGDFFNDIGRGLGRLLDGEVLDGVGDIVGGTLKGAGRTIGLAGKAIGDVTEAIFADGQVTSEEIASEDKPGLVLFSYVAMLAKMAKADGRVTRSETRFFSVCMDEMGLDDQIKAECQESANELTRETDRTIYEYAQLFSVATDQNEDAALDAYFHLWRMALADGEVADEEAIILRDVPQCLGLDGGIFNYVCDHPEVLTGGNEPSSPQQGQSLEDCYTLLGCSPNASDTEVKRCYKMQMAQYHPDAISGKNLAPAFIEFANQQAAKINEAYETIKTARGMR